jgi:hypothetical protein
VFLRLPRGLDPLAWFFNDSLSSKTALDIKIVNVAKEYDRPTKEQGPQKSTKIMTIIQLFNGWLHWVEKFDHFPMPRQIKKIQLT